MGGLSSFEEVGGWGKEYEEHLLLLRLIPFPLPPSDLYENLQGFAI